MVSSRMIIDDFNLHGLLDVPSKADAILFVDTNRELTFSIPFQCLETIAGKPLKRREVSSIDDEIETFRRRFVQDDRKRLTRRTRGNAVVDVFRPSRRELHIMYDN